MADHITLSLHVFVDLSTAAPAWLRGRGCRNVRDASGGAVREGRGTPLCVVPAVTALPSLAAHLHHHHEHGPAAVGGERGKMCSPSCPCPPRTPNGPTSVTEFMFLQQIKKTFHAFFRDVAMGEKGDDNLRVLQSSRAPNNPLYYPNLF